MHLNDIYEPHAVVVVYKKPDSYNPSRGDAYIEMASVTKGKVGPMQAISKKGAHNLGKSLIISSRKNVGGVIPGNLMYVDFGIIYIEMIWYSKPKQMPLFYDKDLEIPNGLFNMPWTVWHLHQRSLTMYATKEKPTLETPLYNSPFHNTNKEGIVCLGTGYNLIAQEFTSFETSIARVEEAFYETVFTAHQYDKIIDGNINLFHKEMIETGKPFPYEVLIKRKETIAKLINSKTNEKATSEEEEFGPDGDDEDDEPDGDDEDDKDDEGEPD